MGFSDYSTYIENYISGGIEIKIPENYQNLKIILNCTQTIPIQYPKLISLDRMRDFLDQCKNVFFMESDCSNENEISSIVEDQLIPKPVDLSQYARAYIPDYQNITEIPQENLAYLNSGLVATSMSGMFDSCNKLQSIPKLNIDTSKCISMTNMFYECQTLTSLDLSNFNTSNVSYMGSMFYLCNLLTTIDLSNFNTSSVTDMHYMFYYCQALTSLDLSNFDTSSVTDMRSMFYNCQALEHIEGIIDMKSCTDYGRMFYRCNKLSGVKIKNPPDDFESVTLLYSYQYEIVS